MKRAFSIFFLVLFLFNVGGYYFVYWALQSKAKKDLAHRLDVDNFASSDLIILPVPMSLPYPLQQQGYERVDGEFEYQGEYYRLVKQRLENDTLFLVCIKDNAQKKLVSVLNEYTNLTNNLPASAKHTVELFGKLFKDFTSSGLPTITTGSGWALPIPYSDKEYTLLQLDYPVVAPPPRG